MDSVIRIPLYVLVGGVTCWLPDVVLHLMRRSEFSRFDVLLATLLMPASIALSYLVLMLLFNTRVRRPSTAFFMFVGIWVFGSLATMVNATPTGGGFSQPGTAYAVTFSLLPLPPYTFIMATYDMSLAGLAFASVVMLSMHVAFERHHWILPRTIAAWLHLPVI